MKINFNEIESKVKNTPGIYQIYTKQGIALKVGIGVNICNRLLQHRASRQSGLKLKPEGSFYNPNDVISKSSILAKHLYFDKSITTGYNLKTQEGRNAFLIKNCYIEFEYTENRDEAKQLEIELEASGLFRYQEDVIIR